MDFTHSGVFSQKVKEFYWTVTRAVGLGFLHDGSRIKPKPQKIHKKGLLGLGASSPSGIAEVLCTAHSALDSARTALLERHSDISVLRRFVWNVLLGLPIVTLGVSYRLYQASRWASHAAETGLGGRPIRFLSRILRSPRSVSSSSADAAASAANSTVRAVTGCPAVIVPPAQKTLSALICNYNDSAFIGTAIAAMAAQKRLPDELLIMDDGSTDNSVAIMTQYADKYPWIKIYKRETNAGYISGISELTAIAKGDFIHRGTSDDYALPNFVSLTMEQAERHPQVGIVSGELLNRNESHTGTVHIARRDWRSGYVSPEIYLHDYLECSEPSCTLAPSTIFRRAVIDEVGGWRRDLDIWDVSFVLQAAALKYGMCYVNAQVYTWVDRPRRWTANTNVDLAKTARMCLRYYELMCSPEFRPLFGETFPRQWLKSNLNQGVHALYENTVRQFG